MEKNWAQLSSVFALLTFISLSLWITSLNFGRYWTKKKRQNFKCGPSPIKILTVNFFWDKHLEPQNLRLLCLSYVGMVIDSNILTGMEQCELFRLLSSQFTELGINKNKYKILNTSLLYRSSDIKKPFDTKAFDSLCNKNNKNNKNLVILLHNHNGNVIGGFMSIELQSKQYRIAKYNPMYYVTIRNKCVSDSSAFLFRVRSCSSLPPKVYTLKEHEKAQEYALSYSISSSAIISFGTTDLLLSGQNKCFCSSFAYEIDDPSEFIGVPLHAGILRSANIKVAMCKIDMMEVFNIKL